MSKYSYRGPEILTELLVHGKNKYPSKTNKWVGEIKQSQFIDVKCSKCGNIKHVKYSSHVMNRVNSKYEQYMCHGCVNGLRMTAYNKKWIGHSLEERIGKDKADIVKEKLRKFAIDNNLKSRLWDFTGKTWEKVRGIEKARKDKEFLKHNNFLIPKYGKENPQWGKPAHKLSGKGTKGYYNGIYFRSLMEASFIINFLEKNNIKFENGELKKYTIPYIYEGRPRNYFCDFVSGNIFYEIKPKALFNTAQNRAKWKYGKLWCENNGFELKIYSEKDYKILTQIELDNLKECGKLILI